MIRCARRPDQSGSCSGAQRSSGTSSTCSRDRRTAGLFCPSPRAGRPVPCDASCCVFGSWRREEGKRQSNKERKGFPRTELRGFRSPTDDACYIQIQHAASALCLLRSRLHDSLHSEADRNQVRGIVFFGLMVDVLASMAVLASGIQPGSVIIALLDACLHP